MEMVYHAKSNLKEAVVTVPILDQKIKKNPLRQSFFIRKKWGIYYDKVVSQKRKI